MDGYLPYVWIAVIVIMSIIEASTVQFISIWFVIGGISSFITSFFTDDVLTQILVFFSVSIICLICTAPFIKNLKGFAKTKTNYDRYIGMTGRVKLEISNETGTGQVNISGNLWSAKSADGTVIPENAEVIVEGIEGVKLIVREKKKTEEKYI